MRTSPTFLALLLASAAVPAMPANAQDSANGERIKALEEQVQDLSNQVQDLKRSTSDQYTDIQNQQSQAVKVGIVNGRPTIASADGDFSLALRTLVQFDTAYYMQSASAKSLPSGDLSSGSNFRRVYLGIQGKLFGDWSYYVNFDFGGSGGTETPGHIQSAYLEYDGLAPLAFRAGAFPPPSNLEDGTSSGDTIFLERNSPSNLQRNLAGGDGREAISILYAGDRLFAAVSLSGGKVQDTPVFDEQQAVVGRVSYLLWSSEDAHFLIGANGTHIFKLPDALANGVANQANTPGAAALNSITLSDAPELTVDSGGMKLVSTGALSAKHLTQWGVETAGNLSSLYAQAGYYSFQVDRAATAFTTFTAPTTSATTIVQPSNNSFDAWYVQASWFLTGESRAYNPATGAFTPPKPADPFHLTKGGWGAWELAARYSDLNLNSHVYDPANVITGWTPTSQTYSFYNTVRGGDQRIVTAGVNWYPNNAVRFALDYQWIDVNRLKSPADVTISAGTPTLPAASGGQNLQTIAFRVQFGF
ncbi:MAG TPA: porin [Rhizomicrobium sp.]|nr:porin [Rhizomicrobium sp.]